MRRLSVIFIAFISLCASAQYATGIFQADINIGLNSNGILAIDINSLNVVSDLGDPSLDLLDQLGLWMMATDQDGKVHINSQYVIDDQNFDFSYAPLDTFTGNQAMGDWNHVWFMEASEVADHIENFSQNGYVVPDAIQNWPAKSGQDLIEHLAPFADYNNNGVYDPENGDYPVIKGEKAAYCIFNDNSGEHKISKGIPLGVEVHLMLYSKKEWENTIFLEYFIINRSENDYTDVKLALMLGGQLGNSSDNAMGSISSNQTVYLYNGDENDENGFGSTLPYVYCRLLDHELSSAISFSDDTNDTISGRPSDQEDFVNYMNARWLNDSMMTFGGNGREGSQSYAYQFDLTASWNETSSAITPGERNGLAVCSIEELDKGAFIELNAALGFGTYQSGQSVHNLVDEKSAALRRLTKVGDIPLQQARVFPNPTNGSFTIQLDEPGNYLMKVVDFQGKTVFEENKFMHRQSRCNILLPPGVYVLELNRNGRIFKNTLNVQP